MKEKATEEQVKGIRDALAVIASIVLEDGENGSEKMQGRKIFDLNGFQLEVNIKVVGIPLLDRHLEG